MIGRRIAVIACLLVSLIAALPTLAAQSPVSDECLPDLDFRDFAADRLADGDYTAAYDAYTCVIQLSPDDWAAVLARGSAAILAAAHEGNFALDFLADYAAVYRNGFPLLDGLIARETRRLDEVPAARDSLLRRGVARYVMVDYAGAAGDFYAALNLDRHDPFASLLVGMAELERGQAAKAGGNFGEAVELAPDNPGLYAQIGQAYFNNADFEEAIDYLTTAIDMDPAIGAYYYMRGYAHMQRSAFEVALADFDRAIELEPGMLEYHHNRGYVREVLDDVPGVIEDYSEVIRLDPDYAYAYQRRGWAYIDSQQYEAAVADFEAALELDPFERYTSLGLGTAYSELGDLAQGAAYFEDYVQFTEVITRDVEVGVIEPAAGEPLRLDMDEGYVYSIPFSARDGDILTIAATAPRGGVDPMILLLGPDGAPLVGSDDVSGSLDAAITGYEVPARGTYTLIVTHAGGGSVGPVDVTVEIGISA